jgi:hypothetical protein
MKENVMREINERLGRSLLRGAATVLGALLAMALTPAGVARAIDFCACEGSPDSLGDFDLGDPAKRAGAVLVNGGCSPVFELQLPETDGTLVFRSFIVRSVSDTSCGTVGATLALVRNLANTPATILVEDDFTVAGGSLVSVNGGSGSAGTTGAAGVGGQGGPGGFAGGDGAYQNVTFSSQGGTGVGPGGGVGAVATPFERAAGGTFVGVPELRPLLGGSGGGGGHSSSSATSCSAGGGGGGGGAILIAANGTITVNGEIQANGGHSGNTANAACSSEASGGSGGAVRLVATTIQGNGFVRANGGALHGHGGNAAGNVGGAGRIRLEGITNTLRVDGTTPVAIRAPAPGPLVNPITPTVKITAIDGIPSPTNPIGHRGQIDPELILPAPGIVQVDLRATDVPTGTDLEVTVKPKVGAPPFSQRVTLTPASCTGGTCNTAVSFDLAAGAYIVEARATFETP